jgi:3'-5' exoribonuclease
MKPFYVNDAAKYLDQLVTSLFVVQSKQVRTKKNGEPYLALTLADRTGTMEAKLWHHVEIAMSLFEASDFVLIQGRVSKYNERHELTIEKLRRATADEIEPADFLPKTETDIGELWRDLTHFIDCVQDSAIRALLTGLLTDPEISSRLKLAPAAKVMHHAYLGGLLEHIVSLCKLCDLVSQAYPWLNRDLLIAGAILHDIGKIYELGYSISLDYTDEGRLLGHMSIGLDLLRSKLAGLPEVTSETAVQLEHIVLSHHGTKELGSPIEPSTPEAIVFSHLDNLDAKAHAVRLAIKNSSGEGAWTDFVPSLRRAVRKTKTKLSGRSVVDTAA